MPFVLVDTVHIDDVERMNDAFQRTVIPGVKRAPGFVHGTWSANREDGRGIAFIVFGHRDEAEAVMRTQQSGEMSFPDGVTLESAIVYEVQGEA
jgi:hypothetical protein